VKTLVLRIPDELETQLEVLAARRGKTKSAIAREVLSRGVRRRRAEDLSVFDLMRDQIGIIETGAGDLASNPKHLEGFGG
jgi:predicted DNA-binding protein